MRKTTSKTEQKEVSAGLHLTLPAIVAEDLFTLVHSVWMQALQQLLEMDRTQLCGQRDEHAQERAAAGMARRKERWCRAGGACVYSGLACGRAMGGRCCHRPANVIALGPGGVIR